MKATMCSLAAAGAAATLTAAVPAADQPTMDALQAQIAELRREVASLRQAGGRDWLTEARAEEIRGLVQEVLADADTRASLLQGGTLSGYDGGFFINSSDGAFSLVMNGQLQVRYVYNNQDAGPVLGAGEDENRAGFEIRRAKLKFKGHVGSPDWQYVINGGFDRDGGLFELEEATITRDLGDGWTLTLGQYKAPFQREELISSSRQLAVERSLANEMFTGNRTQGIMLGYEADMYRFMVSVDDGFDNGDFGGGSASLDLDATNSPWQSEDVEFSFSARGELLIAGEWGQFKDFTSPRGSERGVMAGVAFHWQKAESGSTSGPEEELWAITGDLSYEDDGWHAFVAATFGDLDVADRSPFAVTAQGGYYFTDDLEGFIRWELLDYDTTGMDDPNIITFGWNKYFSKQVKWTTDFSFATETIDGVSSSTGWREDEAGEDGQFVIRSQLQLVF